MTPITLTIPSIPTSLILWVIGGVLALIVLFVRITHHFATKKIDADLAKALDEHKQSFIAALEKHTEQAEHRAKTLLSVIENNREKLKEHKAISDKLHSVVMTGGDWADKLEKINQNTMGVGNNKRMMRDIRDRSAILKDILNEIRRNTDEINNLIKSNHGMMRLEYGKREDDLIFKNAILKARGEL